LKKILKESDVVMATHEEIEEQTGCKIGSIASFGIKNKLKTLIAKELFEHEEIYVGTGVFGFDFVMSPEDLKKATDGETEDICETHKVHADIKDVRKDIPVKKSRYENRHFLSISDALKKGQGEVNIRGWVYRERKSNAFSFVVLRDESDIIQCVVKKDSVPETLFNDACTLTNESSVMLTGELKKDPRAPTGYELVVSDMEIEQVSAPFPITKDFSEEFLLDNRHLWIRSRKLNAVFKIRHTVTGAIHEFFRSKGYYEYEAPIFQPNMCEGGSTLFEVKYFNDKVYLSQSWQLYAEAGVFSLGKIYNMSPTFRSEKSKTSRHLAEFWMAEMEAAWMKLDECAQVGKDEVRFIVKKVLENNKRELEILGRDIKKLEPCAEKDYPTITYTEALKILKEKSGMDVEWGKDLRTIEEEEIMKHFDTPVAVVEYPKEIMAFYKQRKLPKPKEAPGDVALCFDMLAPEGYGEIIGGSQRDTSIEELEHYLRVQGEKPENYSWYLDLRRYGSVPHSGYGLGVERVVRWICGLDNIKDAIPFPRTMLRKSP
jgi:asparaginyl-tRNA synthetase